MIAVFSRAEPGMVEVRDGAARMPVRAKIGSKPELLRDIARAHAAGGRARTEGHGKGRETRRNLVSFRWPAQIHLRRAVDDDHVPAAKVVAVEAERRRGARAEVAEVAGGARREILVIAGRWTRACAVPAPRGIVASGIVEWRPVFVR